MLLIIYLIENFFFFFFVFVFGDLFLSKFFNRLVFDLVYLFLPESAYFFVSLSALDRINLKDSNGTIYFV